jgi:hypothetical protein
MTGHESPDLSDEEKEVLNLLGEAWNKFLALRTCALDKDEFRRAIHACQSIVAVQVARRADPDFWRQ